jgi:hypothetical protein
MPKRPNDEDLRIIMEMFESSVDGNLYDPEKFGSYYKPYGLDVGNTKSTPKTEATKTASAPVQETAPAQAPAPKAEVKAEPVMAEAKAPASASANGGSTDAADILAMIRNRKSD